MALSSAILAVADRADILAELPRIAVPTLVMVGADGENAAKNFRYSRR
ncbi:hypothetical protein ACLMAJ_01470 [Nocardia sp. KC 131]